MAASTSDVAASCAEPSPKIAKRMAHSLIGEAQARSRTAAAPHRTRRNAGCPPRCSADRAARECRVRSPRRRRDSRARRPCERSGQAARRWRRQRETPPLGSIVTKPSRVLVPGPFRLPYHALWARPRFQRKPTLPSFRRTQDRLRAALTRDHAMGDLRTLLSVDHRGRALRGASQHEPPPLKRAKRRYRRCGRRHSQLEPMVRAARFLRQGRTSLAWPVALWLPDVSTLDVEAMLLACLAALLLLRLKFGI